MTTKILRLKNERGDELEIIARDQIVDESVKVVLTRIGPPTEKISDATFTLDEFENFVGELHKCFRYD